MANETHHDSDDKGSDREGRKAFFLLVGQKTCLALGIADDVAVPAHLRRGKASRPEWRKIWEHLKDIERYEKQLWHPRQRRGEGSGLKAGASSTGLGGKTGPLAQLESCQPVVGGKSKTGASGGSSGGCSWKDASFQATTEAVGGLSGQGNESI